MEKVFIGIGGNLGDAREVCLRAIEALRQCREIDVEATSSLYRSKPVGPVEQDWFINGVAQCRSRLEPEALLGTLMDIEAQFGRKREVRWGPRTLDLDLLAFGDRIMVLPNLRIPHPRLHERLFVLVPLAEIAPGWVHPELRMTAQDLLKRLDVAATGQEILRLE
jgi:2-amino-4-hydroxy-6-hydroxymethyldihydropteridine diphosphokinase